MGMQYVPDNVLLSVLNLNPWVLFCSCHTKYGYIYVVVANDCRFHSSSSDYFTDVFVVRIPAWVPAPTQRSLEVWVYFPCSPMLMVAEDLVAYGRGSSHLFAAANSEVQGRCFISTASLLVSGRST